MNSLQLLGSCMADMTQLSRNASGVQGAKDRQGYIYREREI